MPRRLRRLLGLSKVEDEHGYKAPKQMPTVASVAVAPLSADYGAVDGGRTHNAPEDTDGTRDETLLSGRNRTLSQTMAVDSNSTRSLGQNCSYWERAAKQLEDEEPIVFAALQKLREESSRTSKDLPNQISQIVEHHRNTMENKQWSLPFKVRGREVKIRAQLDNVWKVLQTFNAVGSTLASLDPVHAGIPFAGVNFIVQGALNDSAQNAAAMEGLSRISAIVDRYLLVEMVYLGAQDRSRHEAFERCLVDLYASILQYQVAAACHCKRSPFSRFLRNLPKMDDWAKMLNDIDKKDIDCQSLASVFDSLEQRSQNSTLQSIIEELDKRLGSIQCKIQREERESTRAENARILSWICDHIPGRDHQDVMVHKKMGTQYAHSGQWLLDHHEFLSWRFGEDQGLSTLWVYGSVGTGKTSLVSRVIEWHLQKYERERSETYGAASCGDHVDQRIRQADPDYFGSIAYFYCIRQGQDHSGTKPAVILRSLVRQLACSSDNSSISSRIRTFYDKLRYDRPDSGRLPLEECSELLTDLIPSYSNTTIILDALDECEEPYKLLRALKRIANSSTGYIKLFVSSRLNVNVSSVLIPRSKIDIQSQSTSKDMDIFLHTEVKKADRRLLKGNFPELEDRLIKVLRGRAQGMFRWAELQLAIFLDENSPFRLAEDVISKLDRLEEEVGLPDLDSVYDEIYQKNTRVGTHDRENVMKTIKFLLYSFVEWDLHDLANAISLNVDGTLNLAIDAGYVMEICSNFIVVDSLGYVQFAHLSVREYFNGGRSAIVFSGTDAHAQIAEVCLAYVMSPRAQEIVKMREVHCRKGCINKKTVCNSVPSREETSENAPRTPESYYDDRLDTNALGLHMYASVLCLEHCMLASMRRQEGTLGRLFTAFMSNSEINAAFLTWIQSEAKTETFPNYPRNWTAQFDFIGYLIKRNHARAHPQDTFFAACIYGFTEIIQDTMRSAVKVDMDIRNESGYPALFLASKFGPLAVAELLLDKGADPNISHYRNARTPTPLYASVLGVRPNMVALLLSRGADASARFGRYTTYFGIMDDCRGGGTLLHALARERGIAGAWGIPRERGPMEESNISSIVSLLLEHGVPMEAVNSEGQTPLHVACVSINLLAMSTLLHHGASQSAQNQQGLTPLMSIVKDIGILNGSTAAMELLLKKASIADIVCRGMQEAHSVLSLSLDVLKPDVTLLILNNVDLEAARELGTEEGDEFVELSRILETIKHLFERGSEKFEKLKIIVTGCRSQRSMITYLQPIAETVFLANLGLDYVDHWTQLEESPLTSVLNQQLLMKERGDDDREMMIHRMTMRHMTMMTQTMRIHDVDGTGARSFGNGSVASDRYIDQ